MIQALERCARNSSLFPEVIRARFNSQRCGKLQASPLWAAALRADVLVLTKSAIFYSIESEFNSKNGQFFGFFFQFRN